MKISIVKKLGGRMPNCNNRKTAQHFMSQALSFETRELVNSAMISVLIRTFTTHIHFSVNAEPSDKTPLLFLKKYGIKNSRLGIVD